MRNNSTGARAVRRAIEQSGMTHEAIGYAVQSRNNWQIRRWLSGHRDRLPLGLASRVAKFFNLPLLPLLNPEQRRDAQRIHEILKREERSRG